MQRHRRFGRHGQSAVAYNGESGESLKGFIGERGLAKVMIVIKPGDWQFIQMGHNDREGRGDNGKIANSLGDYPEAVRPAHLDPFEKFDVPAEPTGRTETPYGF